MWDFGWILMGEKRRRTGSGLVHTVYKTSIFPVFRISISKIFPFNHFHFECLLDVRVPWSREHVHQRIDRAQHASYHAEPRTLSYPNAPL